MPGRSHRIGDEMARKNGPIEIAHPAPLRFVRRGMRKAEDDCVQVRTAGELVEAAPEAFRHAGIRAGVGEGARDLFEHEGRLWRQVTAFRYGRSPRPVRPHEMRAWLSGKEDEDGLDLARDLRGTPLVETRIELSGVGGRGFAGPRWRPEWRSTTGRGAREGEIDAKAVLHDGTAEARRALGDFLAHGLRATDRGVFVRASPVAHYRPYDPHGPRPVEIYLDVPGELWADGFHLVTRPDLAGDLDEDWTFPGHPLPAGALREVMGAVPAALLDDGDLALVANLAPRLAVGLVEGLGRARGVDKAAHAGLLARVEAVRAEALLGAIGGIPAEGREGVVTRTASLLGAIAEAYPDGPETRAARRFHGHAARRVLPRFEGPVSDADLEGIASLAPR